MNQQQALIHNYKALRAYTSGIDRRLAELMQVLHEQGMISEQHIHRIDAASTEVKNETAAKLGINMNPPD